jgi:hypothetical protein
MEVVLITLPRPCAAKMRTAACVATKTERMLSATSSSNSASSNSSRGARRSR